MLFECRHLFLKLLNEWFGALMIHTRYGYLYVRLFGLNYLYDETTKVKFVIQHQKLKVHSYRSKNCIFGWFLKNCHNDKVISNNFKHFHSNNLPILKFLASNRLRISYLDNHGQIFEFKNFRALVHFYKQKSH
jgi:hypothetical protein